MAHVAQRRMQPRRAHPHLCTIFSIVHNIFVLPNLLPGTLVKLLMSEQVPAALLRLYLHFLDLLVFENSFLRSAGGQLAGRHDHHNNLCAHGPVPTATHRAQTRGRQRTASGCMRFRSLPTERPPSAGSVAATYTYCRRHVLWYAERLRGRSGAPASGSDPKPSPALLEASGSNPKPSPALLEAGAPSPSSRLLAVTPPALNSAAALPRSASASAMAKRRLARELLASALLPVAASLAGKLLADASCSGAELRTDAAGAAAGSSHRNSAGGV